METWIEFHIHTEVGSSDSFLKLEELVNESLRLGLNGICISEHFSFRKVDDDVYKTIYKSYFDLIHITKNTDLLVFPGLEIRLEDDTEYLVYGIIIPKEIFNLSWNDAVKEIRKIGGLVIKAHPFRNNNIIGEVDGIEVYNSVSSKQTNNACAKWFLNHQNLCYTVGSDVHFGDQIGQAVTIFNKKIESNMDLVEAIKAGEYSGFVLEGRYYDKKSFFCRFE